jgi:hypothetical protein
MSKEEIKEKYGIEMIGKEMWVWDNNQEDAFLWLVIYKKPQNKFPYITIDKDGDADFFKYASETNPNEPKKPKVGDKGFFWNKKDGYVFSDLIYIDHDGSSIPYYCSLQLWFRNFSHENQPWMK